MPHATGFRNKVFSNYYCHIKLKLGSYNQALKMKLRLNFLLQSKVRVLSCASYASYAAANNKIFAM